MKSEVLNQTAFVSTFLKRKEKAITHSYLKTKLNRTKTPTRGHASAGASFNDLLSSHSIGIRLQTSKATHKSPERNELRLAISISFPLSTREHPACQPQSARTCAVPAVTRTPRAGPFFFHLLLWRPQGWENVMIWIFSYKPSSEMRNTPAWQTSLRNCQILLLKGKSGCWTSCWYWVYPYEHNWKRMKTLEGKKELCSYRASRV